MSVFEIILVDNLDRCYFRRSSLDAILDLGILSIILV